MNPVHPRPAVLRPCRLPGSATCLTLAATGLAALLLIPLARAWQQAPDLGHGWAAPLLIAYLLWERWPDRPALVRRHVPLWTTGPFLVITLTALLALRLLLESYPLWPMAMLFYVSLLAALALGTARLLAGAKAVRWIGGPLLMLAAVIPWPTTVETSVILPIRESIAILVAEISNLAGHPALATGTSVRLGNNWVGIDEACGGIRSLQATVLAALFAGEWLLLGWRRRVALAVFSILAAVAGNFVRVLFLTWCAVQDAGTLDRWHDPAGWLALGFSIAITGWLAWYWRPAGQPQTTPAKRARSDALAPATLATLCGIAALLLAIEASSRLWYAFPHREDTPEAPRWTARLPVDQRTYRHNPLNDEARAMLVPDHFSSGTWIGADGVSRSANYIEWHSEQAARAIPFTHNPTICLPSSGYELVRSLGTINVPWENGVVPFHTHVFRRMDQEMLVAFTVWDPQRGQLMESVEPKTKADWWIDRWQVVRQARLNQPAQMLSFAIRSPAQPERLPQELAALLTPAP
ncbi:MAG: exosortase/archaeosortase family protein [Verrucomicrobiota bacterium]